MTRARAARVALIALRPAAVILAVSSIARGMAPHLVPFSDPGFQGRIDRVLWQTGLAALIMAGVAAAALLVQWRAVAAVIAVGSLMISAIGIVIHNRNAHPWKRLERVVGQVDLPKEFEFVADDRIDRLYDDAPGVRRTWSVPQSLSRDEACDQLRRALTPIRGSVPPQINPGRCDLLCRAPTTRSTRGSRRIARSRDQHPSSCAKQLDSS